MPIAGAAIGAGASIIGGLMGQSNVAATNAANLANQEQLEGWEEQMSDTAMQRRVTDLQAAGLNPLLAVSQGGASTPGMSPVSMQASNAAGQGIAAAGGSVQQAMIAARQLDMQQKRTDADVANTAADTANKLADNPDTGTGGQAKLQYLNQQTVNLMQDAANMLHQQGLIDSNNQLVQQQASKAAQDVAFNQKMMPMLLQMQTIDLQRAKLGLPSLQNDAAFQSSALGQMMPYVKAIANTVGSAAGLAKDLSPMPNVHYVGSAGRIGQ